MQSALHQEALRLAGLGIPVFPCVPLTKTPATEHGFHDASTDPAVIDAWWGEADYNIAFQPQRAGMAVIDPDGQAGLDALATLELAHGVLPTTMTVLTPRGGKHLYFKGDLPPTQGKLALHVDTRGGGSYVLVPPSIFYDKDTGLTGSYRYEGTTVPADIPAWPGELIAEFSKARVTAGDVELDLKSNVARAVAHLKGLVKAGYVAVEGEMGNATTYETATAILNLGLTEETALALMEDHFNPACIPPWDHDDLAVVVGNAARYSQNEAGAWAVGASSEETFKVILESCLDPSATPRLSRYRLLSEEDQDTLPEPEWLIPNFLTTRSIGMVFGPSMTFKSFLGVDIGMTMASGIEAWGMPAQPGRAVIYAAGEGPHAIARKRRPAWRLVRGVDGPVPFYLVGQMPVAVAQETIDEFIAEVKAKGVKPALVIIDTLARFMGGLDESSAKDCMVATAALERIKDQLQCSVLVLHHTGKDVNRGARGSQALLGNFDAQHEIVRAEGTTGVAVWPRKQKDAELLERPWMFEGKVAFGSLVFDPVDADTYAKLSVRETRFTSGRIGAALERAGAVDGQRVTTHVLASEIVVPDETDTPEQHNERVDAAERSLNKLAKRSGQAFLVDGAWMWGLEAE